MSKELEGLQPREKVVVLGDFNAHLGFVGPQELNWNGDMVLDLMEKYSLILLNADDRCNGIITRSQRNEASAIDFILVSQSMYNLYIYRNKYR